MVLLQHDELFLQGLALTLQIHPPQVNFIQNPPQSNNVSLHSHPHGLLILIPERISHRGTDEQVRDVSLPHCKQKMSVRYEDYGPIHVRSITQVSGTHRCKEHTHFTLKSSAASFALSMSRTVLALSLEATRIFEGKESKENQGKSS